jgi:hypothetical protein
MHPRDRATIRTGGNSKVESSLACEKSLARNHFPTPARAGSIAMRRGRTGRCTLRHQQHHNEPREQQASRHRKHPRRE